ncbi:MAG: Holliday junction resolvase RuvX [Bacteroidales bacterium]|nr:Holliday junction resolvase RuvX [Bacteroidales bacterium]
MGRYLAIDYGSKRCGIAISDPTRMITGTVKTVPSHELMNYLGDCISRDEIDCVVFGKPLKNDNTPSDSFLLVERFVNAFKKRFPGIRIAWEDERYSSKMASRAMVEGGVKRSERRKKENIDSISAAIILQSFLDRENNQV